MKTFAWLLLLAQIRPGFIDVATHSTFTYITNNGFSGGRKYFPQPLCGGIAVLDFDNDGLMDLYFTNGAEFPSLKKANPAFHNALLRNLGGGRFEDVTQRAGLAGETLGYSLGAAAADYDNDGFPDLFVANAGTNTLYRNQGDGTFRDVTAASGIGTKPPGTLSVQAAWLDYNHDGHLDLVLSNYTLWTPASDQRCVREDGVEYYCHPKTYPSVPHRLFRNTGRGTFQDVTETAGFGTALGKGMGIGVADVNGDGWEDIFIANDTEGNFLYINQKNGTFLERGLALGVAFNDDAATVSAMGTVLRDFDNDGWPDVFYNDLTDQVWGLFRNVRGQSFRDASAATGLGPLSLPFSGWSAAFLDYNNDGWRDIFSANGDVDTLRSNAAQHDTIFENLDGKRFLDVSSKMGDHFQTVGYQRGAAIVDLNNDGHQDIVVTSLGLRPAILLNSASSGGHWLTLRLVGHKANRDSIGARITITTPSGRKLYDWLSPSSGFLSSHDPRVTFGLGAETKAATIEIIWPGGSKLSIKDVAADRILTLHEPIEPNP